MRTIIFLLAAAASAAVAQNPNSPSSLLDESSLYIPISNDATGIVHSALLKEVASRVQATPERRWNSTTRGYPCPTTNVQDVIATAPTNSLSVTFVPLCTLIGAPRDIGKIRVPIYVSAGNQQNPSLPVASPGTPNFVHDDLVDSLQSLVNYYYPHPNYAYNFGGTCNELYYSSQPFPDYIIHYVEFCQIHSLGWEFGYQGVKLPVVYLE